ncbi:MAG TPA: hypothetical protein VFT98_07410 [Myxococcota bacterium]|nr:hypothetical protein [Myxococcota bacterium]
MSAPASAWPSAQLDDVARLRALAAALPNAAYAERMIAAPFDAVWAVYGDLERGVPRFEWSVRALEIVRREGDALEIAARGPLGPRARFRAIWRPGWCVMSDFSGRGQIGMAAAPEGATRTRVAHFEGTRVFGWLARPFLLRAVRRDLARVAELCERA